MSTGRTAELTSDGGVESDSTVGMPAVAVPRQTLRKTLASVAPASLLMQLLSFGSSMIMAMQLGARTSTDAYYLALSVPVLVYAVLMAALRLGGIPGLTAVANTGDDASLSRAASELVSATTIAALLLSILLTMAMMAVLPAAAGGSARLDALIREYLAELFPYAVTGAMIGGIGAALAVRGSFVPATLVLGFEPVVKSVLVLLFRQQLGVQALVIGNLAGNFVAVVVLWAVLSRRNVTLRPRPFWSSRVVRSVFMLSAPLVVSQSLLQLNPLIDRTTAAAVGPGRVTMFDLGVRLFSGPMTLLAGTFIAPLAANWSAKLNADGWQSVTDSFGRGIAAVVAIVPPLVVAGVFARHDLVELAYASHAYTPRAVDATANVFGALLVGMVPQIMIVPLSTLFVIRGDTIFPMKVGIVNCALNALLDLALRFPFGITGIAVSTAITMIVLCGVYVREARKRWGRLGFTRARRLASRSAASCVLIAAASLLLRQILHSGSRWSALLAVSALGVVALLVQAPVIWLIWRRTPVVSSISGLVPSRSRK